MHMPTHVAQHSRLDDPCVRRARAYSSKVSYDSLSICSGLITVSLCTDLIEVRRERRIRRIRMEYPRARSAVNVI